MRKIDIRPRFAADYRALKRTRHIDRETLQYVLDEMEASREVPATLNPHALKRELTGLSEFHLDSDVLVIYRLTETTATLLRIGTHTQLFKQ